MKKLLISTCVLAGITSICMNPANALDLKAGMQNVGGQVKSSANANSNAANMATIKKQINLVVQKSDDITKIFDQAILAVATAILTKDEITAIKSSKKVANASAAEKNAQLSAQLMDSLNAQLKDEAKATETVKALTAQKKELLLAGLNNILYASIGYLDLATEATNLVSQIASDPASAISLGSDFKALKKVATNIPKQGKQAGTFAKNLVDVLKKSGIKFTAPTDKSTKPKAINLQGV